MTRLFIEQPLASPGSANYLKFWTILNIGSTQACPLRIFWGRNIADKPKNLSVQLPQKLSSPYPIFQLPQKFVQLPYLQQKFVHRELKSPAAEEIFT